MSSRRISCEKPTIRKVIDLYQAERSQTSVEPEHCEVLPAYVQERLDKCVLGEGKPACRQCLVYCYQPAKHKEVE